jgi:hypothetical protein
LALLLTITVHAAAQAQTSRALSAAFASIRWLEGRWVGSGGQFKAFYEEYVMLNDSTIEQREVSDSTFTKVKPQGYIILRRGEIAKLNEDERQEAKISVVADTMTFTQPSGQKYRWIKTKEGWKAELGSVTYLMRKIKP